MENSCTWLIKELSDGEPSSLRNIYERHRSRDDSFDLSEVLTFLPDKSQPEVASLIQEAIAKTTTTTVRAKTNDPQNEASREREAEERTQALKAGVDMTWFLVQNRKRPPNPSLRELIVYLHENLLSTTDRHIQNQISKTCEWMWGVADPRRDEIVPCTLLYLLLRSFGEETKINDPSYAPSRKGGTVTDVRRVYTMRKALNALNLSPTSSHAESLRTLLLRCTSSAVYLRVEEGRKFLAHLLTIEDVQNAAFDALVNQLATVRKHSARLFGIVFLFAWKVQRSDWLAEKLMKVSEDAICAGSEPYASNLRTVLSVFHASKRVNGVDLLLNRIYGPVLFGNLMVANAVVRRNAVMIMADAFPIHDPGELREEIAYTIGYQCSKLLELLEDPSPIVRKASVEGSCRVLGLFWDLVHLASAKRMIDIITSKLAFDTSSAQVRLAVFEGIEFMVQNHLAVELLSRAVPRLKNLIHDKVERVRLAFLDLLISIKAKRLQSMRYFDIVPVEDLLLRLPRESAPAATKIMNLIVTSYFPLEKKDKTSDEIALSRRRACLSMLGTSKEAAKYFYKHVNLHVPPGPLCEFVMTIAEAAVEARENIEGPTQNGSKKGKRVQRKRSRRRLPVNQENLPPRNENVSCDDGKDRSLKTDDREISRSTLFGVVADVLVAISPSLQKEKNKPLRTYLDRVFGGDALKPMLIEEGNSLLLRATVWRMAGCISASKMRPIITIWREQMDSVMDLSRDCHADVTNFHELLAALMSCGIRWKLLPTLSAVISGWSDGAVSGCRTSTVGTKTQKKARGSRRTGSTTSKENRSLSNIRTNALFALRACSNILLENNDFRELFLSSIAMDSTASSQSERHEHWTQLISSLRKGSLGAIDHSLESENRDTQDETLPGSQLLLGSLADTWKTALMLMSSLQYDENAHKEMRELLQWCAGDELWLRVFSRNEPFGIAMISLCLGFSADIVALGTANENDLLCVEKLAQNVGKITEYDDKVLTRAVLEILRIAFMLREQYVLDCNDVRASSKPCRSSLRRTASSMLKLALDVLIKCQVRDERLTGIPAKETVLEKFLCGVMLEMQREGDPSDFQQVFSSYLLSAFSDSDTAEHNLLASTLCNIFTTLVTSSSDVGPSNACDLYPAIVTCMRFGALGSPSDKAVASFTGFTMNALFQHYTNTDTTKSPTVGARQFFAQVQDMIGRQFPETDEDSDASQEVPEELDEVRSTLNALRNLTEKDVETKAHHDERARVVLNFDELDNSEDKNEER